MEIELSELSLRGGMALARLDRILRRGARWLALLGFVGLLALAVMMTVDAILRTFFSAPLHGVNDVSAVVMAVVIASCIPANLSDRKNISVEVLGAVLGVRVNDLLRLFSSLVIFGVVFLMAWQFVPFVEGMYSSGRRTWVLATLALVERRHRFSLLRRRHPGLERHQRHHCRIQELRPPCRRY